MGFLDRITSGKGKYPTLDESSPAAERIDRIRDQLESLSKQVHKPLEVVPEDDGGYIFIGKPPKNFGVAWIEAGQMHSFKTLADEGVEQKDLMQMVEKLRRIYEANQNDARFTTKIGKQSIVVTPSEQLRSQVSEVLHHISH